MVNLRIELKFVIIEPMEDHSIFMKFKILVKKGNKHCPYCGVLVSRVKLNLNISGHYFRTRIWDPSPRDGIRKRCIFYRGLTVWRRTAPFRSAASPWLVPAANAATTAACRSYACCSPLLGCLKKKSRNKINLGFWKYRTLSPETHRFLTIFTNFIP